MPLLGLTCFSIHAILTCCHKVCAVLPDTNTELLHCMLPQADIPHAAADLNFPLVEGARCCARLQC